MTRCTFDPKLLLGQPIGMLHCPSCSGGCMILAGLDHGICDDGCEDQDDADREAWQAAYREMERLEHDS